MSAEGVALIAAGAGVIVPVHARPRGRQDAVVGTLDGALVVETVSAPADGAANESIRRILAGALGLRRADVELTSGAASRKKRFRVDGIAAAAAHARLAAVLGRARPCGPKGP